MLIIVVACYANNSACRGIQPLKSLYSSEIFAQQSHFVSVYNVKYVKILTEQLFYPKIISAYWCFVLYGDRCGIEHLAIISSLLRVVMELCGIYDLQ